MITFIRYFKYTHPRCVEMSAMASDTGEFVVKSNVPHVDSLEQFFDLFSIYMLYDVILLLVIIITVAAVIYVKKTR